MAQFASALRDLRGRAGDPPFRAMAARVHRSQTVLSEAAGGRVLPTWETTESFVRACGIADRDMITAWRGRWAAARDALAPAPGPPTGTDPAATDSTEVRSAADSTTLAVFDEQPSPTARGGRPRLTTPAEPPLQQSAWLSRLPAALIAVTVLIAMTAAVIWRQPLLNMIAETASSSGRNLPTVQINPPPVDLTQTSCAASTEWAYTFDAPYEGQAYLLLASPTVQPAAETVSIIWGAWAWRGSITVPVGDVGNRRGGVLISFTKSRNRPDRNPAIRVTLSTPACAAFGIADPTAVAPSTVLDTSQGWTVTGN